MIARQFCSRWPVLLFCVVMLIASPGAAADKPSADSKEILIGVEYAPPGLAKEFSKLGVPVAKFYPDEIPWGKMQKSATDPIDFRQMDRVVREYHDAGFQELVLVIKSYNSWASRGSLIHNITPKPEYLPNYAAWVKAVVERYDHDGRDDMPGLKRTVRYFEFGSEFSSFEPEPVEDYLEMLAAGVKAAREASKNAKLLHAAFLTTGVLRDHPGPKEIDAAFAAAQKQYGKRVLHKSLSDLRAVLDRPELFDAVNFHALGDPYEIEDIAAWLRQEMRQRKYSKPLIISDTTPTPFIAWGPATRATGPQQSLGIVIQPATESDRPRLAAYFQKLIDNDAETLRWTHVFVAADMVQKIVVAAEQEIELINTSFMEDLFPFKFKLAQAGAGTSAWGGMADVSLNLLTQTRTVNSLRPSFFAIQQVQRVIKGYDRVERVPETNHRLRVYRFHKGSSSAWVAWLDPNKFLLPGDAVPQAPLTLNVGSGKFVVESMQVSADRPRDADVGIKQQGNTLRLKLTPQPIFVRPER
jgi:hypothetical protein